MTVENRIASAFRLTDAGWARHANPWSGWSRALTTLPLLIAATWSRAWLGHWSAIPIAAALWWIWFNPRAFGPARDDHAWMTKGVLGERLWANRGNVPVPERHRTIPTVLNCVSLAGVPLMLWGLASLQLWPTLLGTTISAGAKLWYVDRMAILYGDMVSAAPQLRYQGTGPTAPDQSVPTSSPGAGAPSDAAWASVKSGISRASNGTRSP